MLAAPQKIRTLFLVDILQTGSAPTASKPSKIRHNVPLVTVQTTTVMARCQVATIVTSVQTQLFLFILTTGQMSSTTTEPLRLKTVGPLVLLPNATAVICRVEVIHSVRPARPVSLLAVILRPEHHHHRIPYRMPIRTCTAPTLKTSTVIIMGILLPQLPWRTTQQL